MRESNLKNIVVLKNLPSNFIEEAFVILKSNKAAMKLEKIEKNKKSKSNTAFLKKPYSLLCFISRFSIFVLCIPFSPSAYILAYKSRLCKPIHTENIKNGLFCRQKTKRPLFFIVASHFIHLN